MVCADLESLSQQRESASAEWLVIEENMRKFAKLKIDSFPATPFRIARYAGNSFGVLIRSNHRTHALKYRRRRLIGLGNLPQRSGLRRRQLTLLMTACDVQ
jgi:hypothetical protein